MRSAIAAMATALATVALAITLGPACSIDPRSDDFRCTNPGQCGPGRDCVNGWCVVDPSEIDASTDCPAACTSCMDGACVIECDGPGECASKVTCPGTMPCIVRCTGASACDAGVECGMASSCEITCGGPGSCGARILCGQGSCSVSCSGGGSCNDGIDCSDACECVTECGGTGACAGAIECPGSCTQGGQCTRFPPGQCQNC